jgi:hypothetical protein
LQAGFGLGTILREQIQFLAMIGQIPFDDRKFSYRSQLLKLSGNGGKLFSQFC